MNQITEEYVEYLLTKGVHPSLVSSSTEVPIIEIYEKCIKMFGETPEYLEALKQNKKFYGVK